MDNSIHPLVNRSHSYQLTMRAIGQVLDWLHVYAFEIEANGKDLMVHGMSKKYQDGTTFKALAFKSSVKIFRPKSPAVRERPMLRNAPPAFAFSGMRFSHDDLDRLELHGRAKRSKSGDIPAFNTWSQALRALGANVDYKRASILRVSGGNDQIAVAYKTPSGAENFENFTPINLYDLWVPMYKRRSGDLPMRKITGRKIA